MLRSRLVRKKWASKMQNDSQGSAQQDKTKRFVEVFCGAYASGKSENALNRAIHFARLGEKITLVDLDSVEPAYCLRPIIPRLEVQGIDIVAQRDYFGLGEAGGVVTGEQINCLSREGNIIIDVGYGASGLDTLDILTGIDDEPNLKIYLVVNTSKFETCSVENIIEYFHFAHGLNKKPWKKFSGIISNTHFGSETTREDIIHGYEILKEAAEKVDVPIIAIGVDVGLKAAMPKDDKYDGVEIWYLERHMPDAMWS